MSSRMTWDEEIDAAGLLCPLPVLKARKRLLGMAPGQVLRLLATDPASVIDVPHFCNQSGDTLLRTDQTGDLHVYLIRKGSI
jgi:tRNA 2-thiouridine synthesizing protein A